MSVLLGTTDLADVMDLGTLTPQHFHMWDSLYFPLSTSTITWWGERRVEFRATFAEEASVLASYSIHDLFTKIGEGAWQSRLTPEQRKLGNAILRKIRDYHQETLTMLDEANLFTQFLAWIRGECRVSGNLDQIIINSNADIFTIKKVSEESQGGAVKIRYVNLLGYPESQRAYSEQQRAWGLPETV